MAKMKTCKNCNEKCNKRKSKKLNRQKMWKNEKHENRAPQSLCSGALQRNSKSCNKCGCNKCNKKSKNALKKLQEQEKAATRAARSAPKDRPERAGERLLVDAGVSVAGVAWQLGGREARRHWNFYAFASLSPSNLYGFLYALLQFTSLLFSTNFFGFSFTFFSQLLVSFLRSIIISWDMRNKNKK